MKAITRTIWILSLVSLFNDIASEMLIPVMPLYLKTIGFSVMLIGVLEGLAEATSSLSKGYFGKISDNLAERAPFIWWGYALSAISKPMMGLFTNPVWVFASRTADRLGKGVRTAARDAMLSDESEHHNRSRVFGFNRALDTIGATIGPALAVLFLYMHHGEYRTLFYFSFFPGIVAVALTFLVKDKESVKVKEKKPRVKFFAQFKYWNESPKAYRHLLIGILFFSLFNSSDAFLILKLKEAGSSDFEVIGIYVFYNLIYALVSFPIGIISDRVGEKKMLLTGLLVFAIVYIGITNTTNKACIYPLFVLYGFYYACTEGVSKACISRICDKSDTATALGVFAGLQSICYLLASTIAGIAWYKLGSVSVFLAGGISALLAFIYLLFVKVPQVAET